MSYTSLHACRAVHVVQHGYSSVLSHIAGALSTLHVHARLRSVVVE